MYHKLCNMLFLLLPIGIVHATGSDNEIHPEEVRHPLNPSVVFRSQAFPVEVRGAFQLTVPYQSSQSAQQRVYEYQGNPESVRKERGGSSASADGREQVRDSSKWPHCPHGHLDLFFGESKCGGSGVLVGPYHVLTCAHNVYDSDKNTWVSRATFYPGLNGTAAPFPSSEVVSVHVNQAWISRGDVMADMALLTLSEPVGKTVGYYGLAFIGDDAALLRETVEITGYPGDKGSRQMWSMPNRLRTMTRDQFEYAIDTYAGQSGSAIWISQLGTPYVIGIHTRGGAEANSGVRISQEKFTWLTQLIAETGEVFADPALASWKQGSADLNQIGRLLQQQLQSGALSQKRPATEADFSEDSIIWSESVFQGEKRFEKNPNSAEACYYMGFVWETGHKGHTKNRGEAIRSLQKAAGQGHLMAQRTLTEMKATWEKADNPIEENRRGEAYREAKDFKNALRCFQRAAAAENADALDNQGYLHYTGQGVPQDYEEAKDWFSAALLVDERHAAAMYHMGMLFYNGHGVHQDYREAFSCFQQSANWGEKSAQNMLGEIYLAGNIPGIAKNYDQVALWQGRAAAQGHPRAQFVMGWLCQNGLGGQRRGQEIDWFRQAARQNDSHAQEALRKMGMSW